MQIIFETTRYERTPIMQKPEICWDSSAGTWFLQTTKYICSN